MKKVTTYTAQIYVGLRVGYGGEIHSIELVEWLCQDYVNEIGWCVTVTPTSFYYKNGEEPGAIIGAINYPRFPITKTDFKKRVMKLAGTLLIELKQLRVSIVFPDETVMLEKDDYDKS